MQLAPSNNFVEAWFLALGKIVFIAFLCTEVHYLVAKRAGGDSECNYLGTAGGPHNDFLEASFKQVSTVQSPGLIRSALGSKLIWW